MNKEEICRCCLALDMPLLSIYEGGSSGMGCVADMLQQISKLVPQPMDNLPRKACLQCISDINRCYVFKMKCENSDRTLRQLLPDAVPEPLDFIIKKVDVNSSSVQTEDKILISTYVQTVSDSSGYCENEEKPFVSDETIQNYSGDHCENKGKPFISDKVTQTEYEISELDNTKFFVHGESFEDIIICDDDDNIPDKILKNAKSPYKDSQQVEKKLCVEKCEEFQDSETNAFIIYEDSNFTEEQEIYVTHSIEDHKKSECNRYEYYGNEEESQNDDSEKCNYQDNDCSHGNINTNNNEKIYKMENLEVIPKSSKDDEIPIRSTKSTICTRASNKAKRQYKCSRCIMTFVSIKVLKRHLANRHDIKDVDIIIDCLPGTDLDEISASDGEPCTGNTAKLYDLNMELTSENVAKPQLMPRGRVMPLVNTKKLPNIKYFCEFCQAGFAQRKTLTYHTRHKVCTTSNFKCDICESIFVSQQNLNTHKLAHESSHKCLECDTACRTMDELSKHMIQEHNRNARNQCHVCKKVFTMKTSLMDHLRIHSGEKPFLCTICGKSFNQNSNLRQHLIRHTNKKNFKCDACPNAYVTKAELFSHKRIHTGDHPFKCNICDARFTTSCSLKKHVRKHTGERPYACEFCPMRFAALNVLKNHRRIHTGEKPYKCAHCSRAFTQKGDCLMHERTHVNDLFKCFCESKFSKKSNLTHHIRTKHPRYTEREIQTLLMKSLGDNSKTKKHISATEDGFEKNINKPPGECENDGDVLVTVSEAKASSSSEELLEIVLQEVC